MSEVLSVTKNWIHNFVIKHNLCPFAKSVFDKDEIFYSVTDFRDAQAFLDIFGNATQKLLNKQDRHTTAFIIIKSGLEVFEDFLDVYHSLEDFLVQQAWDEHIQLASFHPQYIFDDATFDDAGNYTNRSPYPMIHLLLVDQVEQAIRAYGDTSMIPERNVRLLRGLGTDALRK